MTTNENEWKTEDFRAKVVSQIEDAVRQSISSGNSAMLSKKPADLEAHVYYKAKSREEYMTLVARLLVCIRDVQNISRVRPMQNVDQSGMQTGQTQQQFINVQPNQIAPQQPGVTVSQAGGAMAQYSIVNPQQIQNRPQIMPSVAGHQVHIGHPSRQVTIQQAMQIQQQKATQHQQQQQQQQQLFIAQQQQQAALKAHVQQTYPASVSATQSQPYSPHPQPHPSPQTPSQMPSPRPAAQQHPVSTSATHAGRAIHAPSPVQVSQGRPPPTPKPQPSPVSQNVIAPSPVAHVPSPAPPGSTHAAPSPSPQVAASPAGPPSVPTPSTLGSIQSPASIYNPGSVGPSVTSPAPMNPADEQAYLEKLKQLSVYISPLQKMINKLAKEEHSKSEQYKKLTSLLDILANPTKRVTMATLLKVENLLKKVIHTPPSSASTTTEPQPQVPVYTQAICHPLLDVVNQHKKLPLLAHTLQRTFGPILHAIEGPPICPPLPPSKRIRLQENEKKSPLPHALQGEIARLSSRFSVWPSPSQSTKHSCSLLKCSLSDKKLPAVPPIQISVPRDYPYASPECLTGDYGSTPFLQKIQTKLSTKLLHMPEMYSVTALLDAWETSIRQTCNSEVAALS